MCSMSPTLSSDEKSLRSDNGLVAASLASQIDFRTTLFVLSMSESNSKVPESTSHILKRAFVEN